MFLREKFYDLLREVPLGDLEKLCPDYFEKCLKVPFDRKRFLDFYTDVLRKEPKETDSAFLVYRRNIPLIDEENVLSSMVSSEVALITKDALQKAYKEYGGKENIWSNTYAMLGWFNEWLKDPANSSVDTGTIGNLPEEKEVCEMSVEEVLGTTVLIADKELTAYRKAATAATILFPLYSHKERQGVVTFPRKLTEEEQKFLRKVELLNQKAKYREAYSLAAYLQDSF